MTEPAPTPSPFYQWLLKQSERDDPIGDLASDVRRDSRFPVDVQSLDRLTAHLIRENACNAAVWALSEAHREFTSRRRARSPVSPAVRFEVFRRYEYSCRICGATAVGGVRLEVDHIVPVASGGTNEIENLQILCFDCNRGKGVRSM